MTTVTSFEPLLAALPAEALHRHFAARGFIPVDIGPLEEEVAELRSLLQSALQLEHATIPPYLTGLYSLKPTASWRIAEIIRTVVVEEMLHVVLAANTLNAIGGNPTLTGPDFIPDYPAYLPYKVDDLKISLIGFSPEFIQQGLGIERPKYVDPLRVAVASKEPMAKQRLTIGEFYVLIESRLRAVVERYGEKAVFTGDPRRQIRPDLFYYGGDGQPVVVKDLQSAVRALQIITDQGEGIERTIWVDDKLSPGEFREVAHYFRFNELAQGRMYREGDTYASGPTGELLEVSFSDAYPIVQNAKVEHYPARSELRAQVEAFNRSYCRLLELLERAFRGEPDLLLQSVPMMYTLRYAAQRIMKNPLAEDDLYQIHAAPTFQYVPPHT